MTFQEYFTQCQTLITQEINLPFDCLFSDDWIDKYTNEFETWHYYEITPEEAVKMHFDKIDRIDLMVKKSKTVWNYGKN